MLCVYRCMSTFCVYRFMSMFCVYKCISTFCVYSYTSKFCVYRCMCAFYWLLRTRIELFAIAYAFFSYINLYFT
jgi:hypothetical protein